jgi:putative chitinase
MSDLLTHLQRLWPHGDQHVPGLIEGIAKSADAVFTKYGTTSPLVVAMMFGQFSEECGAGLEMEENGNYTAQRLLAVFPTHFTPAMAQRAAHNPRLVFDIAYGGRMGNAPPPSDDGYNFRGRGLSQVTGRGRAVVLPGKPPILEGYAGLAYKTGLPLTEHPELLSDPDHTLECGVADFILCGCLPFAKAGDIVSVTKHLNGGFNGLADRRIWTARWKRELGI